MATSVLNIDPANFDKLVLKKLLIMTYFFIFYVRV